MSTCISTRWSSSVNWDSCPPETATAEAHQVALGSETFRDLLFREEVAFVGVSRRATAWPEAGQCRVRRSRPVLALMEATPGGTDPGPKRDDRGPLCRWVAGTQLPHRVQDHHGTLLSRTSRGDAKVRRDQRGPGNQIIVIRVPCVAKFQKNSAASSRIPTQPWLEGISPK